MGETTYLEFGKPPRTIKTNSDVVRLGFDEPKKESKKKKQSKLATGLDIVSSILLEPTTFIKSPTKAGQKVKERREKIRAGDKKEAVGVIAETLTATGIAAAAVLGAGTAAGRGVVAKVAPKLLPTTIKKGVVTATGAGILFTSPTARKIAGKFIEDPTKVGREAGEVIEKVKKGEETGKFTDVLKTAGVVGGAAALVGGGIALAKKLKGDPKPASPSDTPQSTLPSAALPTGVIPTQAVATPTSQPVVTPSKEPSTQVPSVNVTNNIKINNRSSANRRFINTINV